MSLSIFYSLINILLVLLLGLVHIPMVKSNYCKLSCKTLSDENDIKNIACGSENKFTDKCPSSKHRVGLVKFKQLILQQHNDLRNEIAGGVGRFKPAVRMAYMVWDDELTNMAFLNLRDCRMRLDKCRRTKRFRYSGQNIGQLGFTEKTLSTKEIITKIIGFWTKERRNVTNAIINKFPKKDIVPPIGHFTVMVAENNTHVGCAAVQFKAKENTEFILTCNYATTNIVGHPVYKTGHKAGSACHSGKNKVKKNLCSIAEKYDNASV